MNHKLTEGWKIFLAGVIMTVFLTLFIPWLIDWISGNHPNTHVYLIGQDHSYTIAQLKEKAPVRSKITIHPIKFPNGISSLEVPWIPINFFNWEYSKEEKLYTVTAQNRGEMISTGMS